MNNYYQYFGMSRIPFGIDIDTSALARTEQFDEMYSRLLYIADTQQMAILTAEPGCGKSTLLRTLRQNLEGHDYHFIYISDSSLSPRWLYNKMLEQLGVNKSYYYRGDGKKAVHEQIGIMHAIKKKKIVCCIDEAHLLSPDTFEEIRFLLNCEMDSWSPMALILSGQSELKGFLQRDCWSAVRQRIKMVCTLDPLERPQTESYIKSHLAFAGSDSTDLFSKEAIDAIQNYSNGIPRSINNVCQHSLLKAAANKVDLVNGALVENVIATELL